MNDTPPPSMLPSDPGDPSLGLIPVEERSWCALAHISALSGLLVAGIGFVLGPLIVWLVKKDTMPHVAREAAEALNFNLSWMIYSLVATVVTMILMFVLIGFLLFPLLLVAMVAWIVLIVVAAVRVSDGTPYRYPLTIRFIR